MSADAASRAAVLRLMPWKGDMTSTKSEKYRELFDEMYSWIAAMARGDADASGVRRFGPTAGSWSPTA